MRRRGDVVKTHIVVRLPIAEVVRPWSSLNRWTINMDVVVVVRRDVPDPCPVLR